MDDDLQHALDELDRQLAYSRGQFDANPRMPINLLRTDTAFIAKVAYQLAIETTRLRAEVSLLRLETGLLRDLLIAHTSERRHRRGAFVESADEPPGSSLVQ